MQAFTCPSEALGILEAKVVVYLPLLQFTLLVDQRPAKGGIQYTLQAGGGGVKRPGD